MSQTKLTKLITALVLVCVLVLTFAPAPALAEERSDSLIVLLTAGEVVDNRVQIVATLAKNSGVTAMNLTLSYDNKALTLVRAVDGAALPNLSKFHSGSYDTFPYKVNYVFKQLENDYSKGVLLTFTFEVNENAKNGTYKITLTSERNGVQYLDEEDNQLYKNLVSDVATVTVKDNEKVVDIQPGDEKHNIFTDDVNPINDPNEILSIVIPVTIIAILLVVLVIVLVTKKDKRSKK